MFYPTDSLRRGGKFYLLWLADSWPHRFASISHRQLWSQDVRKLSEDLKVVIVSESGRPTHRYSLRLSSQLMRGLVRMYHKKASMLLNDLCMIHANVMRHSNKKYHEPTEPKERALDPGPETRRTDILLVEELQPEHEARVEEILQASANVVANVQDITLREAVIPEIVLPPNEGFGEENAEQAVRFLSGRRSVEQMLAAGDAAHTSGLLPALDVTARSPDAGARRARMERISADVTLLRPSDGGLLNITELGRDIPEIPDIPILPIPELPQPQEKQPEEPRVTLEQPEEVPRARESDPAHEPTQIELEELEELGPRVKRRRGLIIDKKTQIGSEVLRTRTRDPRVDLRIEHDSEIPAKIQVPVDLLMNRPCHAGCKERSNLALCLTRLFLRNLGGVNRDAANRYFEEEEMQRPQRYHTRSHLEQIPEIVEPTLPELQIETAQVITLPVSEDNLVAADYLAAANVSVGPNVSDQIDISCMLTQKLETLSQQNTSRKRGSTATTTSNAKRQKSIGYVTLSENQQRQRQSTSIITSEPDKQQPELDIELDKENIPANQQVPGVARFSARGRAEDRRVSALLQAAGIGDLPSSPPQEIEVAPATDNIQHTTQSGRRPSETSESLLGSLDRTKVSLGESDVTTDSKRFIRDHWGAEGTMLKVLKCHRARGEGGSITMKNLIESGPVIAGYKHIIAAKCFTSVLKLKQYGFIILNKCPVSLEILDILPGPKIVEELN